MSVRGIEDENIDTRGHERSSLARDVPVDSHGCRDDQATVSVNGGPTGLRGVTLGYWVPGDGAPIVAT